MYLIYFLCMIISIVSNTSMIIKLQISYIYFIAHIMYLLRLIFLKYAVKYYRIPNIPQSNSFKDFSCYGSEETPENRYLYTYSIFILDLYP